MESDHEEYRKSMGDRTYGTFLFTPQWFSKMTLGSVGYFDKTGGWHQVTNLMEEGRPERDGYKPFRREGLEYAEPQPIFWENNSSEIEKGRSYRGTAEGSGAMAAAPAEASVQVKVSNSSTGSAALITRSEVQKHGISGHAKHRMIDWVTDNTTELLEHPDFGRELKGKKELWTVAATWVTKECAIKLASGKKQDLDLSFDVGATGIGKLGGGIGVFEQLKREGCQSYPPVENSKGYVVSFAGVRHVFSRRKNFIGKAPLKEYKHTISVPLPKTTSDSDATGPVVKTHNVKWEDWDLEETEDETEDEEVDDEGGFTCEAVGMSESDTETN
ncbi:hypothetical protein BDV32DRAFT_150496 [Aspergillus pseudonomiae]|uniref:Uncharacterized protein n=1 Tax=Aspergillus pseudonomiae TaxID=1506151 RepID=A0A5N7DQH3_9EURO|nr:uncharacterized protein BDV37DRAFT_279245 [Aspergillus pseudonomiae]KAB8259381.1 hypothetical protein BDV32DRAFT_150496 [Aspergillus pseudonomiae]KAE8408303.1 hypothetical protein BDV37DRAFT_279245 [Aspergillus pseudonomiae]